MEDDLNIFENGRRPQLIFLMEDDLNFFENGRRPNFFLSKERFKKILEKIMQPETLKIKTMVVAPLRVT